MAILEAERQLSFAGGMNSLAAPAEFGPDELSYLLNGLLEQDGVTLTPRAGSKRTHATALNSGAQGWGAIEFHTAAGAQQLVVFAGDKMYYSTDEGATWTNPAGATGLATNYWSLVQMRVGSANYLCCANGASNVYYWDGSTWGTLAGAPSGVRFLAVFNGRLYVAGHDAEAVAASGVGDPTDWALPSAFEVQVHTHDGDNELTGLYTLGTALLAFKRKSVGYIEGFGYQTLQVQSDARGVSRSVGCVAHRTIQAVSDQAVCWLSERGIEWYQLGGQIVLLSSRMQPTFDALAWDEIVSGDGICHAAYLGRENEYRVAVTTDATTTNLVIGVRPPRANTPVALWLEDHPQGDGATAQDTVYFSSGYLSFEASPAQSLVTVDGSGYLTVPASGSEYVELSAGYLSLAGASGAQHAAFFVADIINSDLTSQLWAVGYDGFVRRLKTGTADDVASDGTGGNDVTMTVRTRPFLFGDPFRPKRARILRVSTQQGAATDVLVRILADGASGSQKTLSTVAATQPKTLRAMVSSKALAPVVEIQTSGDIELVGVELAAERLRTRW